MRSQIHHSWRGSRGARGRPALTFKDVTLTYAQLWHEVRDFGAALSVRGLRRGNRVAVYLDKRIETVTAFFGHRRAAGSLSRSTRCCGLSRLVTSSGL